MSLLCVGVYSSRKYFWHNQHHIHFANVTFCSRLYLIFAVYCVQNGTMRDIGGSLKGSNLLAILCNVCITWTVAASQLDLAQSYNSNLYRYCLNTCFVSQDRNWKYV